MFCVWVCIYVCMYVGMCVCMNVCIYVCMYVCMYICMYVCVHVSMYACIYVCMYVCMYVCILINTCKRSYDATYLNGACLMTNQKCFGHSSNGLTLKTCISVLKYEDNIAVSGVDNAALLNEKFQSVFTSENETIPYEGTSSYHKQPPYIIFEQNDVTNQLLERLLFQRRFKLGSLQKQQRRHSHYSTFIWHSRWLKPCAGHCIPQKRGINLIP